MTGRSKPDKKIYLKLFTSTFILSLFTVGGGYVIVTMMKKKFVDDLGWLKEKEMLDIVAIAQSAPGVIAVNTSILLGYRLAGIPGAMLCVIGTVLPPLFVITGVSFIYEAFKNDPNVRYVMMGLRAGIAAIMTDAVIRLATNVTKDRKIFTFMIMITAFILGFVFDINVILIILGAGIIGILTAYSDRIFAGRRNTGK